VNYTGTGSTVAGQITMGFFGKTDLAIGLDGWFRPSSYRTGYGRMIVVYTAVYHGYLNTTPAAIAECVLTIYRSE
jgi:hypothetical protein